MCVAALFALAPVAALDGSARLAAIAVAVALVGLGWGSLRMDALGESVLVGELGENGVAQLTTVAPARSSPVLDARHRNDEDVPARARP